MIVKEIKIATKNKRNDSLKLIYIMNLFLY